MSDLLTCSCGSQTELGASVWSLDVDCAKCGRRLHLPIHDESIVIESREWPAHVFCFLDQIWDNVVVVDQSGVQVGSVKKQELQTWIDPKWEAIPDQPVMGSSESIDFKSMHEIVCNLHDTTVEIETGTKESPRSVQVNLHDGKSSQRFLDLMFSLLRVEWTLEIRFYSRLRAILYPAIGFLVLAILLGLTLWASGTPELDPANARIRPRRRPVLLNAIILAVSLIGWTGISISLAILALSCLIWLLLRLKTPPIKWRLRPRSMEVDRYPALDFDETEPTLWVVRNQVKTSATPTEIPAKPAAEQNANSKQTPSLASNPIAWVLVAFLLACMITVGLVLTLSNTIALLSNVCFLCIHISCVAFLSSLAFRGLTSPRIDFGFFVKLSTASLVLATLSGAAFMMNVAEYRILAGLATGVSALGALFEVWLLKTIFRRNRQSRRHT